MSRRKWQNPIILEFAKRYDDDPVRAVEAECDSLIRYHYWTRNESLPVAPIDIDGIAENIGLKKGIYEYTDIPAVGQIKVGEDGRQSIQLNPERNKTLYRFRFTIAHEIGHKLIRRKVTSTRISNQGQLIAKRQFEEELLCDLAAAEMLMPKRLMTPILERERISLDLIERLSSEFRVSKYVVINRLAYLIPQAYAIYWRYESNNDGHDQALRVAWTYPHYYLKSTSYIPKKARAKDERFRPNILLKCYLQGISKSRTVKVKGLGQLEGLYEAHVLNLKREDNFLNKQQLDIFDKDTPEFIQLGFFDVIDAPRKQKSADQHDFDLISLLIPK